MTGWAKPPLINACLILDNTLKNFYGQEINLIKLRRSFMTVIIYRKGRLIWLVKRQQFFFECWTFWSLDFFVDAGFMCKTKFELILKCFISFLFYLLKILCKKEYMVNLIIWFDRIQNSSLIVTIYWCLTQAISLWAFMNLLIFKSLVVSFVIF